MKHCLPLITKRRTKTKKGLLHFLILKTIFFKNDRFYLRHFLKNVKTIHPQEFIQLIKRLSRANFVRTLNWSSYESGEN